MALPLQSRKPRFKTSPVEQRTLDGVVFDSKREMQRFAILKMFEKAGKIAKLERQPMFQTFIAGKPYCRYTADFSYILVDTQERVIEDVKSSGTAKDAAYRLRKKAAELQYGIKITEVA